MISDEDKPFLLRKLWCHGQSIVPPVLAAGCVAYAFSSKSGDALSGPTLLLLAIISPAAMLAWPFLSWRAVAAAPCRSLEKYDMLRRGSACMIVLYLTLVFVVGGFSSKTGDGSKPDAFGVILCVGFALASVETLAFVSVVTGLKGLFISEDGFLDAMERDEESYGRAPWSA